MIDIPVRDTPQRVLVTANIPSESENAATDPETAVAKKDTRSIVFRANLLKK